MRHHPHLYFLSDEEKLPAQFVTVDGAARLRPSLIPGTTRVIVDAQWPFTNQCRNLPAFVEAVKTEMRAARTNDEALVFVEYEGAQPAGEDIASQLYGRGRLSQRVRKSAQGGAAVVSDRCMEVGLPTVRFRISGLYAIACVFDTARGLSILYPQSQIEVVASACDFCSEDYAFYRAHAPANVRVV